MLLPRARLTATLLTALALSAPALAGEGTNKPGVPYEEAEKPARWTPWATPTAQIQTWFTAWDQDQDPKADSGGYGDPELDTGFNIERARLGLKGGYKVVDFAIRFGAASPYDTLSEKVAPVELVDAWGRLTFDTKGGTTRLSIGQQDVGFSREASISSNDLVFQERAVSTEWLSPVRELGAAVSHDWKWLGARIGVYNGGGNLFGNNDNGVMLAARLEGHVGGDTYRTNASSPAFGIGGSFIYETSQAEVTQRAEVDMLGRIVGLNLLVEGEWEQIDPKLEATYLPPSVPDKTVRMGGLVQLSYYKELPLGAIEPAVRMSYYDDATHLKDNGDVGILHGGVTWREPVPFVDVGAGYIHRFEFQGADLNNDSVRVWAGIKYPSRRFAPLNLVDIFRRMGEKPLSGPGGDEDGPSGHHGKHKK